MTLKDKYRSKYLFAFLFCVSLLAFGLESNSQQSDVDFLLKTIKDDYAGYKDKIQNEDFEVFVSELLQKGDSDTFRIMSKIVDYFNDNHLQISELVDSNKMLVDTTVSIRNFATLEKYFSDAKVPKSKYEGYWLNDYNTSIIGILRNKIDKKTIYSVYLIESKNINLPPGCLIATLELKKDGKFLTDYFTPSNGERYFFNSTFSDDSTLVMNSSTKWKLIKKYNPPALSSRANDDETVFGKSLGKETYLLTIPSFDESNVKIIDSIITADSSKICVSKNLIIDLRGNSGGTVRCYSHIFPFIYTNPIVTTSGYHLASNDLIAHREADLEDYKREKDLDTSLLKEIEARLKKLKAFRGNFMYEGGDTIKCSRTLKRPKNVAVIVNYACASAAELMLLDFKQSRKVKIFGEPTAGIVDYLNVFSVNLPSKKYFLSIASAKRLINKNSPKIDGRGIYPDIVISDRNKDWVNFVRRYYEKR